MHQLPPVVSHKRLLARVEQLADHPQSGGWLPEDDTKTYRQLLQGNYRIIYRVANDGAVYIVAVHHAARLLDPGELS
jgi:plasmid stabilization system protein ParE